MIFFVFAPPPNDRCLVPSPALAPPPHCPISSPFAARRRISHPKLPHPKPLCYSPSHFLPNPICCPLCAPSPSFVVSARTPSTSGYVPLSPSLFSVPPLPRVPPSSLGDHLFTSGWELPRCLPYHLCALCLRVASSSTSGWVDVIAFLSAFFARSYDLGLN